MPKTASINDSFAEILNELTDFKDYFTEDSKINELVDYIHKETGVHKAGVRLAIKRIAPFLATTVGVPLLGKLHGKLSDYSWYLNLSQTLLDSLKTMSDKTLDIALEIPANKHLEALISDKAKWAQLKPEHQGLVQLLLGQNAISDGLDSTRQEIENAIEKQLDTMVSRFSFSLDLITPDFLIHEASKAKVGSAQWLTYSSQQARLIGRSESLNQLTQFFEHEALFAWWAVCGKSGIGKSRLALDAIESLQRLWDVGFLSKTKLLKEDALSGWYPQSPTIIVIDNAAEYSEAIQNWIDYFIQHREYFNFPVRLLILERAYEEQSWWSQLVEGPGDALTRSNYLYSPVPHIPKPLNQSEQSAVLNSFLVSLNCHMEPPPGDDAFWGDLSKKLKGLPLYIGMLAIMIAKNGAYLFSNWDDVLENQLQYEIQAWERQLSGYDPDRKNRIYQLLALSTVVSGFNFYCGAVFLEALEATGFIHNQDEFESNLLLVDKLSGGNGGRLEPDIFGEYFVLQRWRYKTNGSNELLKNRLRIAMALDFNNTCVFLSRVAVDYPYDITSLYWWKILMGLTEKEDVKKKLYSVAEGICTQLTTNGQYVIAMQLWLPLLTDESSPVSIRFEALKVQGWLNSYFGHIEHGDMDKQAEIEHLMSMYHGYFKQDEIGSALDCLKRVLKLYQELGNKSDQWKILNHISAVYRRNGDYQIALSYLELALKVQEQLGDERARGKTLNNIAFVHSEAAKNYLRQAITVQKKVGGVLNATDTRDELLNDVMEIYKELDSVESYALSTIGRDNRRF